MKIRQLITFFIVWFVMLNCCSPVTFADMTYKKCNIPIISDKAKQLTWNGLKKDGIIYITLEDACIITGSKIIITSNKEFVTERNSVKIFGNLENNAACLSVTELNANLLSWDGKNLTFPQVGFTNRILYEQPFNLNMTYFEGKVWVDLFSYANCFGADINILTKNSESYKYLGEVNLTQFEGCYTIETGIPFDEIYIEFMNNLELQFKWSNWAQETGVFVAKGYDAVINEYKNVFSYAFEDYDSTETYKETLLKIIECRPEHFSDNPLIESIEKQQEDGEKEMNTIFFTLNSVLDDKNPFQKKIKKELEDANSIISGTKEFTDVIYKYSKLAYTISKMNEVETMLLEKSILADNVKDEEAYNSKNISAYVDDFADIIKNILPSVGESMESSATKFQKIIESYSSLYDSAEKLNNEIKSYGNLTEDALAELADNLWSMLCNYALGEIIDKFAPEAKPILDIFDFAVGQMKSDTVASVADAAQAHFIQQTVLKNVKLDKSDTSYYSLLMAMQSSYFANKNMLNIAADVSKEQDDLDASNDIKRTSILFQLENLITQAYECNRNFYNSPATDWKNQLIEKITDDKSSAIPDYSISIDLIKQESNISINWHLSPTIEAEDIINSDEDSHRFGKLKKYHYPSDEYSVIKQNGKYGIIKYDGTYYAEAIYDVGGFGVFDEDLYVGYNYSEGYSSDDIQDIVMCPDESQIKISNFRGGRGIMEHKYIYNKANDKIYYLVFASDSPTILNDDNSGYSDHEVFVVEQYNFDITKNNSKRPWELTEQSAPKFGISNKTDILVPCEYDNGCMNDNGEIVALEKDGKWGFFNKNGKQIIDFVCDSMENKRLFDDWCPYGFAYNQSKYPYLATEGYIPVKINGKCGYYDTQGNEIIPCGTFEEVRPVHNGLAWVKQDGRWGVIKLKNIETETNTSNNSEPILTGTVSTEKDPLNVRKSPSTEAKIIGKIDKGSTVTIYSENGDWYETEYNGGVGYVSKEYIKINGDKENKQKLNVADVIISQYKTVAKESNLIGIDNVGLIDIDLDGELEFAVFSFGKRNSNDVNNSNHFDFYNINTENNTLELIELSEDTGTNANQLKLYQDNSGNKFYIGYNFTANLGELMLKIQYVDGKINIETLARNAMDTEYLIKESGKWREATQEEYYTYTSQFSEIENDLITETFKTFKNMSDDEKEKFLLQN